MIDVVSYDVFLARQSGSGPTARIRIDPETARFAFQAARTMSRYSL